jgi:hypothetical protein
MRGFLRASHTAPVLVVLLVSCAPAPPKVPAAERPREPPPRVLVVAIDQVALRTSAWLELHAWLAAAGRGSRSQEMGEPELEGAARAYATALADDDRDEALGRTALVLQACEDERCARAAVTGTPFAKAYLDALPPFLARHWTERATIAREGVEIARSALGPELEPLVKELAEDLAIEWPAAPAMVSVVADAPQAGGEAPIRAVLSARGSCFSGERKETARVRDARIMDCVLAYAAVGLDGKSMLASALSREMARGARGANGSLQDFRRAWTALVVHAVAVTVAGWEPRHASVLRRSALAVMPDAMTWLAHEWPSRMRGEPALAFAKRYADALQGR